MTRTLVFLALPLTVLPGVVLAADGAQPHAPSEVVFLAQVVLLLACGRLLGEAMLRIGQPAVMGQLIAGILLGPSVLGWAWPHLQQAIFPPTPEQKSMIDAVSQLGILLLLLLTGMETDLSMVRKTRRAAVSISLAGIAVPFACGFALTELLPDSMLPKPDQRLITSLFLGVALSISSVKIVAMVVREMNFLRRTVGQVILSAAIIDDTVGWIIMSVIFGIAAHGALDFPSLAQSVLGTALFLVLSFSIGRRLVFLLIRWANDNFVSEVPVITTILVVMGVMALITNAIGVHTVLGAFVAGMLVGRSPILSRHIDEQLRGLITALFMPVFFGLAGLGTDLRVLAQPSLLLLTLGLIVIASVGKFAGAFLGAALGGLGWREAIALGCGMNARGSTEVVVATIGLSMGALSHDLFTMIVAMAVVTTMAMPPMLRWALARLPLGAEEKARLEREAFEAEGFVTRLERLLVAIDESVNGRFASRLAGVLAGARGLPTTILHLDPEPARRGTDRPARTEDAEAVVRGSAEAADDAERERRRPSVDITTRVQEAQPTEQAVVEEASKGYDLLLIGVEPAATEDGELHERVTRVAAGFDGPFAIADARGVHREDPVGGALDILVPVTGTDFSRRGAEVAVALARVAQGSVTALYVATGPANARSWQRRIGRPWTRGTNEAVILREIVRLGDQMGVPVRTAVRRRRSEPEEAILRRLRAGRYSLVVMGVSPRQGETLFFGDVAAAILQRSERSILFVAS